MVTMRQAVDFIVSGTAVFLKKEAKIKVDKKDYQSLNKQAFFLQQLTAWIHIDGDVNLDIAFSFEKVLIDEILRCYAEELDYTEDEYEEYVTETAADVANIVIGNATANFEQAGMSVSISVPQVTSEAKNPNPDNNTPYYSATLFTQFGQLRIAIQYR